MESSPADIGKAFPDYKSVDDKVQKLLSTCTTSEQSAKFYDKWAAVYEKDMVTSDYGAPRHCAQLIQQHVPDTSAKILDVGAGTGLIQHELKKLGQTYTNVDALDGSAQMLEVAKANGLYNNYICTFMYKDPTHGLEENSYDAVASAGAIGPGHLDCEVITEFIRLVKPGGHVLLLFGDNILSGPYSVTHGHLEQLLQEHCDSGEWELVERKEMPDFFGPEKGICVVYRVLQLPTATT